MYKSQIISDLATKSLAKWQNDDAVVFSKCAFCNQASPYGILYCNECLCPQYLCRNQGTGGLFGRISVWSSNHFNFETIPLIRMRDIDQTVRQKIIVGLQNLILPGNIILQDEEPTLQENPSKKLPQIHLRG